MARLAPPIAWCSAQHAQAATAHAHPPSFPGSGRARIEDIDAELAFSDSSALASLRVLNAKLWGPDDPYLYRPQVTLNDVDRIADAYSLDIGIRTVEVQDDTLLLNGQPITLTGFGKHEDFPITGRGLNLPVWVRDHELLKWVGANSYRTAHDPYAEEAMQLADRLGVLVINETRAVGLNFNDSNNLIEQRQAQCLLHLRELVARDKNHPSTIMWSVANEPFGGPSPFPGMSNAAEGAVETGTRGFRALYEEANRLDGTRPDTYAGFQGGARDWHHVFDVVCINRFYGWYTNAGQIDVGLELLASELDELHDATGKPVIITEFGADTVAGLHDWAFADFRTGQSAMRAGGMNHMGVFTRDRRPKMAAHFLRSQWKRHDS